MTGNSSMWAYGFLELGSWRDVVEGRREACLPSKVGGREGLGHEVDAFLAVAVDE